jgi:diguanylate cyclase
LWKSDFGLWVNHKAGMLFEGAPEMDQLLASLNRMDEELVLGLQQSMDADRLVVSEWMLRIEEEMASIKFLLNALFDTRLELESGRDPLTQLLNRRFLPSLLMREIALQKKHVDRGFCLVMIDIDHFKAVNDQHGHLAGDTVLRHVAEVITATVRTSDFSFRYGGEEFLLVLVDCSLSGAEEMAQHIRQKIEGIRIPLSTGEQLHVTASLGVAAFADDLDYEVLLERADRAMYRAKQKGRNRIEITRPSAPLVAPELGTSNLLQV